MGLRISTNNSSLAIQRALGSTQRDTERAMKQLATGSRFAAPGDDAAGFTISEHLRGQIEGQKAAMRTSENAISVVQVAEGGLNEQNNILIRMRELAIQSASDNYSDQERSFVDDEFKQLSEEFDRIAKTTQFGSQKLLDGSVKEYEFQVGPYAGDDNIVRYKSDTDTTGSRLGVNGLSVADKGDARDALSSLDDALSKVAEARAHFGAVQSRFQSVTNNASNQIESLTEAHSKMADADIAEAAAKLARGQVLLQFQAATLAQANVNANAALKLLS